MILKRIKPDCMPCTTRPWPMAGVWTLLSSVKNRAGPRKPIDCMIYKDMVHNYFKISSSQHKYFIKFIHEKKLKHSKRTYLTNICYRNPSLNKSVSNPTTNICKNSHCQPWQDTQQPGFGEIELQNLVFRHLGTNGMI